MESRPLIWTNMLGQIPVLVELAKSTKLWRDCTERVDDFFFFHISHVKPAVTVAKSDYVINYMRWHAHPPPHPTPQKKEKKKMFSLSESWCTATCILCMTAPLCEVVSLYHMHTCTNMPSSAASDLHLSPLHQSSLTPPTPHKVLWCDF